MTQLDNFNLSSTLQQVTLCWIQPKLIINLVRHHSSDCLTSLNLDGYEELNDLVLEFIAGVDQETIENDTGKNRGLTHLCNLTLPVKSFVTPYGLKILLENLLFLEVIKNAGRLGKNL